MKTWQHNTIILTVGTILGILLLLSGCSTVVPVTAKFPAAPETALGKCDTLEEVGIDAQLSDVTTTVANNYQRYHECAVKVNVWQEWYTKQQEIFNKVSK